MPPDWQGTSRQSEQTGCRLISGLSGQGPSLRALMDFADPRLISLLSLSPYSPMQA